MSVEIDEVRDFLATATPFAQLPHHEIAELPNHMGMSYVRRGTVILEVGDSNEECYVIRSGAVDILDNEGTLLDRREAGRSFGYSTLMGDGTLRYEMVAVEDTLLLSIPREVFLGVAERNPDFARFFSSQSKRMSAAADSLRGDGSNDILRTKLSDFMIKNPAMVAPDATIQQAAARMQELNVS